MIYHNVLLIGEIFVIVEYCCFGNLRSYLINHRETFVSQVDESGELVTNVIEDCADDAITTSKLVCWAFQISRGMDYLVSKKVISCCLSGATDYVDNFLFQLRKGFAR